MRFPSYTRIELLLVVAMIGLLASCATPMGTSDQAWSQAMTRNTQLRLVSSQAATAGKLSKADLTEALKRNDEVRALLDRSRQESSIRRGLSVNSAKGKLSELESFLKSKGVVVPPPQEQKVSQPSKKEK